MYNHIIFDLDGTILDSERIIIAAVAKAFKENGFVAEKDILIQSIGLNLDDTKKLFKKYYPQAPIETILHSARIIKSTLIRGNKLPVKKGIPELLETLKSKGCRMAIATSTPFALAEKKLKKLNLIQYFEYIIGADMIKKGKPAPDIFLFAADKLGAPPNDCIVFEDSAPGIQGAHSAGMRVIYIEDIANPTQDILALCSHRYRNAHEIHQDLKNILKNK